MAPQVEILSYRFQKVPHLEPVMLGGDKCVIG